MLLSRKDIRLFILLSRPVNIFMALAFFAFAAYVSAMGRFTFLKDKYFFFQAVIMSAIMAGGYWINDVFDHKIDRINKPKKAFVGAQISTKKTLTGYLTTNGLAALLTLALPFKFLFLNFAAMTALFVYAAYFKRYAVWGNLTIALLTALPIVAGAMLYHFNPIHFWTAIFAFWVNLIREIVKDAEDIHGDLSHGLQTLPINIGLRSTKKFLLVAYIILFIHLPLPALFYCYWSGEFVFGYLVSTLILIVPVWVLCIRELARAVKPADYKRQSRLLKIMMALGLISLFTLPL